MRAHRRPALITAAAIILLLGTGCRDHPTAPGDIAGLYRYTAYNAGDSVVVVGTITLNNSDSTRLTGRWALIAVNGSVDVGPQTGTGTLSGSTAAGVSIDLNPGWADNNVFLDGAFAGGVITGTWRWSTFAGVAAEGRFEMKKL
jgi:hypothetical protein